MYFEDVFYTVISLWKNEFSLKGIESTQTYFEDIAANWIDIKDQSESQDCNAFSDWKHIMIFSIYQTLTQYGLDKCAVSNDLEMKFSEVPIELFEKNFRKNLRYVRNRKFFKKYKGFRSRASNLP
jgi:hypothetical protein